MVRLVRHLVDPQWGVKLGARKFKEDVAKLADMVESMGRSDANLSPKHQPQSLKPVLHI